MLRRAIAIVGLYRAGSTAVLVAVLAFALFLPLACTTKEPQRNTYFDQSISPILTTSCVRTNTGAACHVADAKGNAFGNLDVATFDGINHRRDLLLDYGVYGQPSLLIKNIPPFSVALAAFDGEATTVLTDIKHSGGPILDPSAGAYQTLRKWIQNGATENNTGITPSNTTRTACTSPQVTPTAPGFDPNKDVSSDPAWATFAGKVSPVIHDTCGAGNCHGTPANELYFLCGDNEPQKRWNYFVASTYLAQTPAESELVRRPLSPSSGGAFHEGGAIFGSTDEDGYKALLQFATEHGPPVFGAIDPGLAFFAHRVQPVLVRKGCMMVQCHSAAMFHDYRLRGGSGGSFSYFATVKNYALTLAQISLESEEVDASRLVRKNLLRPEVAGLPPAPPGGTGGVTPDGGAVPDASTGDGGSASPGAYALGILHRGGPLFDDFGKGGASGPVCDAAAYDFDKGDLDTIPAYCVFREWHRRERATRMTKGELTPLSAIVYVKRPVAPAPDRAQDFDVFAGGAELHIDKATLSPAGDVTLGAGKTLDLTTCGLAVGADVRRPEVSWDGALVAFAARSTAADPLQIYTMNADGTQCAKHAEINNTPPSQNGILIHNFDPAWSPPDATGGVHVVFASTRGNLAQNPYDYTGPQRTPADPSKPNSNLYVFEPDPASAGKNRIRQLTFLLNMERQPTFMSDGRVIFTAEKRAPGFYQLALRRMNIDGGDYHPLYAQRGSIGFHQATDVVELADKNFAAIFSDQKAQHGGGLLGVFNRSIGIDFTSPNPSDYLVDPTVIDPNSPTSPEQPSFFLHSLRVPDASATGHVGQSGNVYATPSALPGGKMLVSVGGPADPGTWGGAYDLVEYDPETSVTTKLVSGGGASIVEAVAVYGRANRGVFPSAFDEPNGRTIVFDGQPEADVTILDMPLLASLLFQNTPTGRLLEDIPGFDVYEDLPPTPDVTTLDATNPFVAKADDFGLVYVRRRLIGHAPVASDGSAHILLPGGLPIVLRLPDTQDSKGKNLPRFQREEMEFTPGEYAHQSFRREFFSGLCGNCHGSVSGRQLDVAVQPDMLTQASATAARGTLPYNLNLAPAARGPAEGPPAAP